MSAVDKAFEFAVRQLPKQQVLALRAGFLRWRTRAFPLLKAFHGTFNVDDLRTHLEERIGRNFEILMVHSSLNYARPYYEGSAQALLQMLSDFVGTDRTLAMPAFFIGDPELNDIIASYRLDPRFDARRTPSQMGLLTEIFRRSSNVMASVHPSHRVVARGPLAQEITQGHAAAASIFGLGSPFDIMARRETVILVIGKWCEVVTQVHHAEDILGTEFPVPFTFESVRVVTKDFDGREIPFELKWRKYSRKLEMHRLREIMGPARLREWKFHGVPLVYTRAHWVTEDLIAAAKEGRSLYSERSVKD